MIYGLPADPDGCHACYNPLPPPVAVPPPPPVISQQRWVTGVPCARRVPDVLRSIPGGSRGAAAEAKRRDARRAARHRGQRAVAPSPLPRRRSALAMPQETSHGIVRVFWWSTGDMRTWCVLISHLPLRRRERHQWGCQWGIEYQLCQQSLPTGMPTRMGGPAPGFPSFQSADHPRLTLGAMCKGRR